MCPDHQEYIEKRGVEVCSKAENALSFKSLWEGRADFALEHQHWTMDDWKRVVWSDETKINRLGSDGRLWVWMKQGSEQPVKGTVKFGGGSLMVGAV
jgi:hypothetical protein